MRVGEVNARFLTRAPSARDRGATPPEQSRALVPVAPAAVNAIDASACIYRQAAFLAHLIATREHLPQTRERRRGEPEQAIAAYRAGANLAKWI